MKNAFAPITAAAVLVAATIGFAASANADQSNSPFEIRFHYTKDELASEAGQRALLQRMEHEVAAECTPAGLRAPLPRPEVRKCIDTTMRSALAKFNSDSLASLYTARTAG